MKTPVHLPMCLLLLAGCAQLQPSPPVFICNGKTETPASPTRRATENLRQDATVKAYALGRYLDPDDPRILHEGHVIYVEETPPTWNLQSNQALPTSSASPAAGATGLPEPLPAREKPQSDLDEQRKLSNALRQQSEQISQALQQLNATVPLTKKMVEHGLELDRQVRTLEERLRRIEERLAEPASSPKTPSPGPAKVGDKSGR